MTTPKNMTPIVAALIASAVRATKDIALVDGKLPVMAMMLTPHGPVGMEAKTDASDMSTAVQARKLTIAALRIAVSHERARVVTFITPATQHDVLEFYVETAHGDSWLGRSAVDHGPDGSVKVLDPVWSDGKGCEFHSLINNPLSKPLASQPPSDSDEVQGAD